MRTFLVPLAALVEAPVAVRWGAAGFGLFLLASLALGALQALARRLAASEPITLGVERQ
jgi:hypothetical protein